MHISKKTIDIIKSFSSINQSLLIRPGNVLSTIDTDRTILARATIEENFNTEFVIYDLGKFLGALSLMDEPRYEFTPNLLSISDEVSSMTIPCASKDVIITPPENDPNFGSIFVEFTLSEENYNRLKKSSAILQAPEIVIYTDNGNLKISTKNEKVDKNLAYVIDLGPCSERFNMVLKASNINLIRGSYRVSVYVNEGRGITKFHGEDVYYWIPSEERSKYHT